MTHRTPCEAIAASFSTGWPSDRERVADQVLRGLERAGYTIVPIKPSDAMLEELARIGDGPLISGGEVWGYMLAAAVGADGEFADKAKE